MSTIEKVCGDLGGGCDPPDDDASILEVAVTP